MSERLINVHWVSQRTELAPRTIRKLAETGLLPAIRTGKLWMFRPSDVTRFKQDHADTIRPRRRLCRGGRNARSI
jgi:excisionase family DNA binding protein